ncbi:MAG: sigma-70 family RNA polymerase sigma factor [Planctomycetes bacterium]|nr:sigma-70 family RNA polymerase sigma factor [Planctomycetota bacterium]
MTSVDLDRLLADSAWLRNLTRKLVGDDQAADLQQDVVLAALTQPVASKAGRSWLAAVAHNLAVTLLRRRSTERRHALHLALKEPDPSPAELVATAELQQRVGASVLALPEVYRDTVLMRFLQGLSVAATAQAMNVPEETVRTRQRRALALLRERLEPKGKSSAAVAFLVTSAIWGVVVNSKQVAAAALLLVAGLITWSLVPEPTRPASPTETADATLARGRLDGLPSVPPDAVVSIAPDRVEAVGAAELPTATAATTAVLTVNVHWLDGAPAASVAVLCCAAQSGEAASHAATTDAAGEVLFDGLAPGRYQVQTAQYQSKLVDLVAGEPCRVDLLQERGFVVRGIVLDAGGGPVGGAELRIAHVAVVPSWSFVVGRSDRLGRFQIPGCRGGMSVGAAGPQSGISDFVLLTTERHGGAEAEELVLRLDDQAGALRGRVVTPAGQPVAGAWVQLGEDVSRLTPDAQGRLWSSPPVSLTSTDAEGRFAIAIAPLRQHRLLVCRRGFASHTESVDLLAHVTSEVVVVLHPGGLLTGTVRDEDGQPIAGAEIEMPWWPTLQCSATTAGDGAFVLRDLPPGPIEFSVQAPGRAKQQRTLVFVGGEQQTLDVVLGKGLRIGGRLLDAARQPLASWWLSLPEGRRARTDAEGRFVLTNAAPVGNVVVVRADFGFVPEVLRFEDVVAGEDRTFEVPADRMPSARVRGQCLAADGTPLAGVGLDLQQGGQFVLLNNQVARAGEDGRFDLGPFPPGVYEIRPTHLHVAFQPLRVEVQANDSRDVGLLRGAEAASLLVNLTGEAALLARTVVEVEAGGHRSRAGGGGAQRRASRLFPGRYRLVVRLDDRLLHEAEVELTAGAEMIRECVVR